MSLIIYSGFSILAYTNDGVHTQQLCVQQGQNGLCCPSLSKLKSCNLDKVTHPQQEVCCSCPPVLGAAAAARASPAGSPAHSAGPAAAAAVASDGPSLPRPVACSAAAAPPAPTAGAGACPAAAAAPGHACTAMNIKVSQSSHAAGRELPDLRMLLYLILPAVNGRNDVSANPNICFRKGFEQRC